MKVPMISYNDGEEMKNSWVKLFLRRIKNNQNNIVSIIGATGEGKSYAALSICEMISKENGVPFTVDNVVFDLPSLMRLINSGTLKKGSCVIFDEAQCSISNKEFMSKANKVFNYLVSTFRNLNLTLFFPTPYADLLDLSTRKLFHAQFECLKIDYKNKVVIIKPKLVHYDSLRGKFLYPYLRIAFKPEGKTRRVIRALHTWEIPRPSSEELIRLYEEKKSAFTKRLNVEIEKELDDYNAKKGGKKKIELVSKSEQINQLFTRLNSVSLVAKALDLTPQAICYHLKKFEQEKGQNFQKNKPNKGGVSGN